MTGEIQDWLRLFWCWLSDGESGSTTIRNLGLVIAAVIALWFAKKRIVVADRQAATAQRGLLNERYQKGAEMLGSDILSVRLGGIYALARLAHEHPEDHTKIMSLFCAFVRHPVDVAEPITDGSSTETAKVDGDKDEAGNDLPQQLREDVQAVMTALSERNDSQIKIEEKEKYRLALSGSHLEGAVLVDAHLERANLYDVHLEGAILGGVHLDGANLPDTHLEGAWLVGAHLEGAHLEGAHLDGADLSGAVLRNCERLTQEQIDQASAHKRALPNLEGSVDANTGEPLVWRGRSITE